MESRFASLDDLTLREHEDNRTRKFIGDGTSFLDVPGLVAVESIRVGSTDLPLQIRRRYPTDIAGQLLREEDEPLVDLQQRSDGIPVLIRATISNDGIWQKGKPVFVTGEWVDDPVVTENPDGERKGRRR